MLHLLLVAYVIKVAILHLRLLPSSSRLLCIFGSAGAAAAPDAVGGSPSFEADGCLNEDVRRPIALLCTNDLHCTLLTLYTPYHTMQTALHKLPQLAKSQLCSARGVVAPEAYARLPETLRICAYKLLLPFNVSKAWRCVRALTVLQQLICTR